MTFFEDKKEEEKEVEPEKIKVGETEFTAEELEDLIGAGKKLKEVEEKQGQPFDEILTSWGKRGERIGEYKKKLEEYESKLDKIENPPPQEQIDREKLKAQVIAEAKEFGLVTKGEAEEMFKSLYQSNRAGERMLSSVNKVLRVAKSEGKPETTPEKLLEFMADPSNPKDPGKAYKLMFEKELESWKEEKLSQIKKPSMITEPKSTAGSKQPEIKIPANKEALRDALRIAIHGEGGQ